MSAFFQELFRTGIYKRSQGRVTRQVTFATVVVILLFGLYKLHLTLIGFGPGLQYALPGLLSLAGLWASYRLVNVPAFADFLIAVEAEMNKVSWPTRTELFRSSVVVLVTIFLLASVLFAFDFIWTQLFQILHVL